MWFGKDRYDIVHHVRACGARVVSSPDPPDIYLEGLGTRLELERSVELE